MKVLMLSHEGDGLGIAYKLALEGHKVDVWVKNQAYAKSLVGIVGRPKEWRPLVLAADLIICDMVGFSAHADLFARTGKPVLCCNPVADIIELDRLKGLETFRRAGIEQPKYWHYKTSAEAAAALPKIWTDAGIVVKPFGNLDVGKTYVLDSLDVAKWALTTYPNTCELICQERIPSDSSVEVSTEGWFNGREFITPFNHTLEEKHFLNGGLGKMTGCMGNVVWTTTGDKLVDATVKKLTPMLKKAGYRGPIDVNCIVTKDCAYGLEITARFGYDAIEALIQGLREPLANLLFETATGVKREMDVSPDFLMAVRVTRDPYPNARVKDLPAKERDEGMPVVGLTQKDMEHAYLCDVFLDDGMLRYSAGDGILLKATSFGKTIAQAKNRAYREIKNLKSIDLAYRTDIGDRADRDLPLLREWGWIN